MSGFFTPVVPTTCVVCGGGTPLVNSVYGYVHGRCEATAATIVANYVASVEADWARVYPKPVDHVSSGAKKIAARKVSRETNAAWLEAEAQNYRDRQENIRKFN